MKEEVEPDIKFIAASQAKSEESTPWISSHTEQIPNPIVRFHNEIIEFAQFVEPLGDEHNAKLQLAKEF